MKPTARSTLADTHFQCSFAEFAQQVRGGLTTDEIFGICTTEEDAVATATKLLESVRPAGTANAQIFPGRPSSRLLQCRRPFGWS